MIETHDAIADTLVLAEVFRSYQGEGPSSGRLTSFIRTGGCNLKCRFCDTSYTWDSRRHNLREELSRRTVAEVVAEVEAHNTGTIVITGGEPLLNQNQPAWFVMLSELRSMGHPVWIEVETNGTIAPHPHTMALVNVFNVSPKLANAGMTQEQRIRPEVLADFRDSGMAIFKFVCRTPQDVDTVAAMTAGLGIDRRDVWIMPEGTTVETLTVTASNTVERALFHGLNFTHRMHVLLWGNEKGK